MLKRSRVAVTRRAARRRVPQVMREVALVVDVRKPVVCLRLDHAEPTAVIRLALAGLKKHVFCAEPTAVIRLALAGLKKHVFCSGPGDAMAMIRGVLHALKPSGRHMTQRSN